VGAALFGRTKEAARVLSRRTALVSMLAAAALPARAQAWPNRPVRLLVGATPGGLTDLLARHLADPLSTALGQPVVVENRPGASGITATDLLVNSGDGHTIPCAIVSPAAIMGQIEGGRARAIAVTGASRIARLPNVPTVAEQGLPGFDVVEWYGLAGHASMPAETAERLGRETARIFAMPDKARLLADTAMSGGFGGPDEFRAFIIAEIDRLGRIAREANIRAE
jgi:tripartite-type tricarboxylate transporter receptor subunit TctC